MTKKQLREMVKERISKFENKGQASLEIAKKVFMSSEYINANRIFIYLSCDYEVSTDKIIEDAFKSGKKVYVPIIKKDNKMYEAGLYPLSLLKKGKYGIKRPLIAKTTKKSTDLAIIPLAGFDKQRNRLGRGGGYYDRFLKDYKGKTIALAFSCQELDNMVNEKHDIKPQKIITEEKTY